MDERRRIATEAELDAALRELDVEPDRVPAGEWPGHLSTLVVSGLYSWWTDRAGATALSAGLGVPVAAGRIYAGQTGATSWPSGRTGVATLAGRIGRNHLRGRIRGSTFRFTLAAALVDPLGLAVAESKRLDQASEARLSDWMERHLEVAVHRFPNRDPLANLEHKVLAVLDPPLNLEGRPKTPVRLRLTAMRRSIASPETDALPHR